MKKRALVLAFLLFFAGLVPTDVYSEDEFGYKVAGNIGGVVSSSAGVTCVIAAVLAYIGSVMTSGSRRASSRNLENQVATVTKKVEAFLKKGGAQASGDVRLKKVRAILRRLKAKSSRMNSKMRFCKAFKSSSIKMCIISLVVAVAGLILSSWAESYTSRSWKRCRRNLRGRWYWGGNYVDDFRIDDTANGKRLRNVGFAVGQGEDPVDLEHLRSSSPCYKVNDLRRYRYLHSMQKASWVAAYSFAWIFGFASLFFRDLAKEVELEMSKLEGSLGRISDHDIASMIRKEIKSLSRSKRTCHIWMSLFAGLCGSIFCVGCGSLIGAAKKESQLAAMHAGNVRRKQEYEDMQEIGADYLRGVYERDLQAGLQRLDGPYRKLIQGENEEQFDDLLEQCSRLRSNLSSIGKKARQLRPFTQGPMAWDAPALAFSTYDLDQVIQNKDAKLRQVNRISERVREEWEKKMEEVEAERVAYMQGLIMEEKGCLKGVSVDGHLLLAPNGLFP